MEFIEEYELSNFPQIRELKKFLIGHPGIIAGGCFKSLFSGSKPHDLDMFFENQRDYFEAVNFFKNKKDEYSPSYTNQNVESFIHLETKIRIECIKKIFGTPAQIIDQFDFTIAKFSFCIETEQPNEPDGDWIYTDKIVYHPKFFEHLLMKRLVVDKAMPYPISTFNRCFKYARQGYFPCRETKLKILREINSLDVISESELSKSMYEGHD